MKARAPSSVSLRRRAPVGMETRLENRSGLDHSRYVAARHRGMGDGKSPSMYAILGSVLVMLPAVWTASAILRRHGHK